jgi:hypothetical protein
MYLEELTCPLAVDIDDDDILSMILSSLLHKMDKYCNIVGLIISVTATRRITNDMLYVMYPKSLSFF